MSKLTDRLRAAGADMDGALNRVVNDEELYATCFAYFMDDPAFGQLEAALEQADYSAAFDAAHALKGVAGNLGLTSVYTLCDKLVQPLRHGEPGDADLNGMYRALTQERDNLKTLMAD